MIRFGGTLHEFFLQQIRTSLILNKSIPGLKHRTFTLLSGESVDKAAELIENDLTIYLNKKSSVAVKNAAKARLEARFKGHVVENPRPRLPDGDGQLK